MHIRLLDHYLEYLNRPNIFKNNDIFSDIFIHDFFILFYKLKEKNLSFIEYLIQKKLINIYQNNNFLEIKNVIFLSNGKIVCFKSAEKGELDKWISIRGSYTLKNIYNFKKKKLIKNSKNLLTIEKYKKYRMDLDFISVLKLFRGKKQDKLDLKTQEAISGLNDLYRIHKNTNFISDINKQLNYKIFLGGQYFDKQELARILIIDLNLNKECYKSDLIETKNFFDSILTTELFNSKFYI